MTSYNVTISEGTGGYVGSGYVSSGYVVAQTTMSATVTGQLAASRSASGAITLTDAIPNLFIVRAISQTINAVHSISRKLSATREVTTGTGGYTSSGYVSSGYLVDNITLITETIGRVRDVPVTLTETLLSVPTIARTYAALRTITEPQTITEVLDRIYGAVRTITPTITITENLARILVAIRNITQTVTLTTLLTAFKGVAGTGARRIKEATTSIFKRSGVTTIFKRSANTTT